MAYALTVDQIGSRHSPDLVIETLEALATLPVVLPFVRTVGDEFQGLLDRELSVVDAIVLLMRSQQWHIGLGIGSVETPLPSSENPLPPSKNPLTSSDVRAARGEAFLAARTAIDRAKTEASHLSVVGAAGAEDESTDVQTVFRLLGTVRQRRSTAGWEVSDLLDDGLAQSEAASRLGVTRQAVTQRAQTAQWSLDRASRPTLVRLLQRADRASAGRSR